MKTQIKFFVISYMLFLLFGILSCTNCGNQGLTKYRISSFTNELLTIETIDNRYINDFLNQDEINYSKFGIRIVPEKDFYANNKAHLNFMNQAYACDVPFPSTTDTYTHIQIITNSDFDDNHLTGSDISAYFNIVNYSQNENNYISLTAYNQLLPKGVDELSLLLMQAPMQSGAFTFTIKITLDGETLNEFEMTTREIIINN